MLMLCAELRAIGLDLFVLRRVRKCVLPLHGTLRGDVCLVMPRPEFDI
jgi:hypothetical protein